MCIRDRHLKAYYKHIDRWQPTHFLMADEFFSCLLSKFTGHDKAHRDLREGYAEKQNAASVNAMDLATYGKSIVHFCVHYVGQYVEWEDKLLVDESTWSSKPSTHLSDSEAATRHHTTTLAPAIRRQSNGQSQLFHTDTMVADSDDAADGAPLRPPRPLRQRPGRLERH